MPERPLAGVSEPSALDHIPALDGVRGLAVLLVLMFHLNLLDDSGFETLDARIFSGLPNLGWCGVNLFFVLSGFLITRILFRAKGQTTYFRNFYLRRVVRIFPLYYGVLFLTLILLPSLPSSLVPAEKLQRFTEIQGNTLWFWLYLSNFSLASAGAWGHGVLDVAWSLSIEEQFYLVWPAIVRVTTRRELMRLCVLVMALAFGIRVAMTLSGVNPISIYVLTLSQLDVLAAGAFVALAAEGPGGIHALMPWAVRFWKITAGVLLAFFCWRGSHNMDPVTQTVGFSLVAIHFASFLAVVLGSPEQRLAVRFFSSPVMRMFGKYSYAIYLFHMPIRSIVRDMVYGPDRFLTLFGSRIPGQLIFYALVTGVTLVAAYASWHFYEKHFLKLKRFAPLESGASASESPSVTAPDSKTGSRRTKQDSLGTGPREQTPSRPTKH
ncbi:MAG TPA: acyltransferase [Verrucomicrobiae bacterium]|nr:acyltransferase [Verrucomicrobiae bacterium]